MSSEALFISKSQEVYMGYYSDTAIALTRVGKENMSAMLENIDGNLAGEVRHLLHFADEHAIDPDTQAEVWLWRDIKWYEDDPQYSPEIAFVRMVLEALDESEYRFIRIGEDYDDTEVRGDFTENTFDLELARGITIQVS